MLTKFERNNIYNTIFTFFRTHNLTQTPTPLPQICEILGIELVPLTRSILDGFSKRFMFGLWGNTDGALQVMVKGGKVYAKIGYNDFLLPERRRFTIAEEICHFLLGHYTDRRADKTSPQFCSEYYEKCEQQARFAAGMMLCPPWHFFRSNQRINAHTLSSKCAVSPECARVCINAMMQYKSEFLLKT